LTGRFALVDLHDKMRDNRPGFGVAEELVHDRRTAEARPPCSTYGSATDRS
jgi:hypothetical protein